MRNVYIVKTSRRGRNGIASTRLRDHSKRDRQRIIGKRTAMDLSSKHTTPAALRSRGDRFRDHSNHDRRKIIGERIAMEAAWEVHDARCLTVLSREIR